MINFHCTIIPVVVLYIVITHTSAWFLGEIHQLVSSKTYSKVNFRHMQITDVIWVDPYYYQESIIKKRVSNSHMAHQNECIK